MEQHFNNSHVTEPPEHVTNSTSDAPASSACNGTGSGAKYKLMSPAKLPISRSPCITIPPGLSPSSFLESPVLLSNIKAEPSPTTGSFFKPQLMQGSDFPAAFSFPTNNSSSHNSNDEYSGNFEFQFQTGPGLSSGSLISAGLKHRQSEPPRQVQDQCLSQSEAPAPLMESEMPSSKEFSRPSHVSMRAPIVDNTVVVESEELTQRDEQNSCIQVPHSDPRDMVSSVTADRSSEDGYNWRKYGQKLVKGSVFPRSYYKCTYPNCEVKKIFERSPEGHITEIVYKGSHDHPKPQPSRRYIPGPLLSIQEEKYDKDSTFNGQEDKFDTNGQSYNADMNGINGLSPQQTVDDGQDGAVAQSQNSNDDIDEEDPFSKRRKIDGSVDIIQVVKPIREPRVVVQTVSEVDILDDGYRWRKYGQKVVRGNPNPRSYYKCTNAGCPVRKHVERASHDPKAVITTYEGKHNHDVPTARSNTHEHSGPTPVNGISRIRSQENNSVSLDLGVGNSVTNSGLMGVQTAAISGFYGMVNGGMRVYGSR